MQGAIGCYKERPIILAASFNETEVKVLCHRLSIVLFIEANVVLPG